MVRTGTKFKELQMKGVFLVFAVASLVGGCSPQGRKFHFAAKFGGRRGADARETEINVWQRAHSYQSSDASGHDGCGHAERRTGEWTGQGEGVDRTLKFGSARAGFSLGAVFCLCADQTETSNRSTVEEGQQ